MPKATHSDLQYVEDTTENALKNYREGETPYATWLLIHAASYVLLDIDGLTSKQINTLDKLLDKAKSLLPK
jgi:hypothetical protein